MRVHTRAVAVAALLSGSWSLASPAVSYAQASATEREAARNLMDEGDKKRAAADLKGALKAYTAADTIMNVPTTTIEVARTQAAMGQLIEAKETLARMLRTPAKPNDPAPFLAARKSAETLNADITAKIPTLAVTTTGNKSQQNIATDISIDGDVAPPGPRAPRKVNPGSHTIVVRLGSTEHKQDVLVLERENKVVTVDVSDGGGDAEKKAPPPPPSAPPAKDDNVASKVLVFGGFGLAAVGVGVGTVTGIMSIHKTNALKANCPNNACPAGSEDDIHSANLLGNLSTIAFVAAGVGAAAGVVGLVLSGGSSGQGTATHVRAVLGPSYAGITGAF
jgi:hypothetical protein